MEMYENKQEKEKALLVSVDTGEFDAEVSIDELEELAHTAGAEVLGKLIQKRERPEAATFVGAGKLAEIIAFCSAQDVDLLIFDSELTPSQQRNLEKLTGVRVIDRTMLILDIFAARARTGEGKLQVELAQLKYSLPRLAGQGQSLSRLGGGIGTRGPGESKLESDRRHINRRIQKLEEQLHELEKRRDLLRRRRRKDGVQTVAIVGYTNAGKSTLLNKLTGSEVLSEDKLFATLDPTTRLLNLQDGQQILLTDTVGFIHKLPHHLIEAFKSTLEEAKYADYIIHVVDSSNPQAEMQMHVVYETLRELGVMGKKIITLFNKQDVPGACVLRDFKSDYSLKISARTGQGLEELGELLARLLAEDQIYMERIFPYQEAGKIQLIREYGQLLSEEYTETGILVKARVPREIYGKVV